MSQDRVAIYWETKQYYAGQPYIPLFPPVKYTFDAGSPVKSSASKSIVKIWPLDTIDCALHLKYNEGLNPVVLNMANAYTPGGGVEGGALAQEESIFRRSNYHLHLTRNVYPIRPNELIYSSKVHISRNSDWSYMRTPGYLDFIASAAINNPRLTPSGEYTDEDRVLMRNKIDHIFQVAYELNHNTLLLGAFGCGAFRNPPHLVADLFAQVIQKYNGYFKRIDFAILPFVYGKTDTPDNFDIFTERLSSFT